ncbi:hypothetical protein CPB86DRAFT_799517 [Serendipita vermifera]|nr:hypothetical protein CPB86DRAFT_799517 [Serendipita vermifera]
MPFSIWGVAGAMIQTVYFNEANYKKKQELYDVARIIEKIRRKNKQLLIYSAGVSAGLALSASTLCPSNLLFTFFSARQIGVLFRQLELLNERMNAYVVASCGQSSESRSPASASLFGIPRYKPIITNTSTKSEDTAPSGKPVPVSYGPSPPPPSSASSSSLSSVYQYVMITSCSVAIVAGSLQREFYRHSAFSLSWLFGFRVKIVQNYTNSSQAQAPGKSYFTPFAARHMETIKDEARFNTTLARTDPE